MHNNALKLAINARTLLSSISPAKVGEFDGKAREVFPLANAFKSAETLEGEKKRRDSEREKWAKGVEEEKKEGEVNGDYVHGAFALMCRMLSTL